MNYKKMKPKIKLKYVYNHISTVKERLDDIKQNLKWITEDVKFIKKITDYDEEPSL